jgi:hypothetical protein
LPGVTDQLAVAADFVDLLPLGNAAWRNDGVHSGLSSHELLTALRPAGR